MTPPQPHSPRPGGPGFVRAAPKVFDRHVSGARRAQGPSSFRPFVVSSPVRLLLAAFAALWALGMAIAASAAEPCTLPPGKEPFEKRTVPLPGGAELALVWMPEDWVPIVDGAVAAVVFPEDHVEARVPLDGFWIGVCEVTQKQWESVMDSNPSYFRGEELSVASQRGALPVESVSWEDCAEFCRRTGLRLPTEMEWWRARNATWADIGAPSWTSPDGGGRTHPAGSAKKGTSILFDMNGNVCEWCADWFAPWPETPPANYAGPATGTERVVCGGCWCGDDWFSTRLRQDRLSLPPAARYNNLGFRVCLTPTSE